MTESLKHFEEELKKIQESQAPGEHLLPNCFRFMQGEFLEYQPRQMLKVRFPVLKESLNPVRKMQGGFIIAAFDNVFGPLSYAAARTICSTLNIETHFHRSVDEGDSLLLIGHVLSRSSMIMHLAGEAYNGKGKLVATCSASMMIQGDRP
jgi:acyl-coenzyme A thioesterase PaaI-like protein